MPTGPKSQKRPADVVSNAIRVAKIATVDEAFGPGIDYAMLVKLYGESPESTKGR
jgi:hypothetical protein